MTYFRKKPVVIEAIPVDHALQHAAHNWKELPEWLRESYEAGNIVFAAEAIHINTLEGTMIGERTDFLIRGVKGELYPCKRDIFFATYEQVEAPGTATQQIVQPDCSP